MNTETNQEVAVAPEATEGTEPVVETVSREDYDKLNETIGSLKRDLKDAKKTKSPEVKETPEKTQNTDNQELIQKTYLRAAEITAEEDVELALETAKKWDMPIDKLVDDEDFIAKLEKSRTARANTEATANVKGDGGGSSSAKDTPEYWLAKGVPPSREQVPDRKKRVEITKAFMPNKKGASRFYNDN